MELVREYQKQGSKTLVMFVVKRAPLFFAFTVLAGAELLGTNYIPQQYRNEASALVPWLFIFSGLSLFAAILLGWLEYIHYHIFIYDDYLKVTRGVFAEEEVGVPYKLVKEVEIERSILDQLFGFSNILITVLGEEGGAVISRESTISLPFLDKRAATEIQNAILERTDVEKNEVARRPS